MFNIEEMPLVLGVLGFLLALLVVRAAIGIGGRLTGKGGKSPAGAGESGQHHNLRSLEAELRVARKKAEMAHKSLETMELDMNELRDECQQLKQQLATKDEELTEAEKTLKDEVAKTVSLRHRLTDQAEETIRANVRARDIETELSVRQAGEDLDDDALEEIAAEHEELTGRLKALQAKLAARTDD